MRSLYTAMCGTEKIYPIPKVPPLVIHTPVDNSAASPSPIEDTVLRAATCRYATLCPFPRIAPRVQAVATLVVDEDRGVAGEHIVRVEAVNGEVVHSSLAESFGGCGDLDPGSTEARSPCGA